MLIAAPADGFGADSHANHGGHPTVFHAFRVEAEFGEGENTVAAWDIDGWIGTDYNRLAIKAEGEIADGNREQEELWTMYSGNVAEFWDAQFGFRYDDVPDSTFYFVAGVEGLAPYYFETELHLFVSEDGDLSVRLRQEHDLLITQRLVLQPYLELNLFAQDVPELDTGAGFSDGEFGLQLRYEVSRKFAPYLDLRYERLLGESSGISRHEGEDPEDFLVSIGVRLRF